MKRRAYVWLAGLAVLCASPVSANSGSDSPAIAPADGKIGYVMTNLFWSVYQTADAQEECPNGFNDGPREQFAALYPDHESMTVVDTQLAQEIQTWHPTPEPDDFPFHEVSGIHGFGLDLDRRIDANDFVHPDGTKGIDNEVYRAVGCVIGFRGPDGVEFIFQDKAIIDERFNRMMIELDGVDDLRNDDHVKVRWLRGRDRLLTDATGSRVMPGGTQRIDSRWGRNLLRESAGSIEDGVLTIEPIPEVILPWENLSVPTFHRIRDFQLMLELNPSSANGVLGGFADVDVWHNVLIRNDSTHHLSNGQISGISLYKALRRLADAYPDPETGQNTAISTSLDVKMVQVFIVDADGESSASSTPSR